MKLHLFLHGKGGIGKSQMAAATADYFQRHGISAYCVDCDPSTSTFRNIDSLSVQFFDVMDGDEVDSSRFDEMLLTILGSGCEHAIVDSGSGGYQALTDYLAQADMFHVLKAQGHQAFLHTVLAGGGMMGSTLEGLHQLAELFPTVDFVLWLNPKDGPLVHEGHSVTQHPAYQRHRSLIKAAVVLPSLNKKTYTKDLSAMLARGQTHEDADADPDVNFIVKNRLHQIRQAFDVLLTRMLTELSAAPPASPANPKKTPTAQV